jgi:hypothetical protein
MEEFSIRGIIPATLSSGYHPLAPKILSRKQMPSVGFPFVLPLAVDGYPAVIASIA